ncbi:uncharacterized protein KD926_001076 [Aspergillus affinis]|uniref:uncharacterized protein n=1 Tax=Aspergillus affinis TaxID=1070780 RepID=UPI0022FE4760|nr:uncharacterized protein KD926_001076 [Aspergillus affinis]KAI9044475.1 hypothetical protein KD926_001076 [Aspergillus affinis]
MLSHGRTCLKGRRVSTLLDNIAAGPDEPLLFLYPRWYKSTVRHYRSLTSRPSASARNTRARELIPRGSPRSHRKLSPGHIFRRWNSSSNPPRDPDGEETAEASRTPNEALTTTTTPNNVSPENPEDLIKNVWTDDEGILMVSPSPIGKPKNSEPLIGPTKPPFNPLDRSELDPELWPEPEPEPDDSQPLKTKQPEGRRVLFTGSSLFRLTSRDQKKLKLQRNRLQQHPDEKQIPWDVIKDTLIRLQEQSATWPKKDSSYLKHKELSIREETVGLLAGVTNYGMRENIWYIPIHHGCKIHLLHPRDGDGRNRRVIISGSDRAVELVSDRFILAQSLQEKADPMIDLQRPPVPIISSRHQLISKGIKPPVIRGTWDIQLSTPGVIDTIKPLAENLSTVREFAEYVEELTISKPPPESIGEKMPHRKKIADALVAVFQVDAYEKLFSSAALNEALSWMCEYKCLRHVYPVLRRAQHVATVDTINILLGTAASRQDPNTYHRLLKAMLRAKIRPNEQTWITFLDHVALPKEREQLSNWLVRQGRIAGIDSRRAALRLTLNERFLSHLERKRSVDSFVHKVNTLTDNWFSAKSIGQMFSVISHRMDYESLDRMLEICREQNFDVDSFAILRVMKMFGDDTFLALRYLYRCHLYPERVFEDIMWEKLFVMACNDHRYNIARVVWRYACMYQGVTTRMKKAANVALITRLKKPRNSEYVNAWITTAGRVIVGLDLHLPKYIEKSKVMEYAPSEYHSNLIAYLIPMKLTGKERIRQVKFAKLLLHRDIRVGPFYRPELPFPVMLEAAAQLDREWHRIPRPLNWLLQNSIHVPVHRKWIPEGMA